MSDFQDFLRHKYAYIAIGEFKPGKFGEARYLFEEAVATYTTGFEGAYLLQESGTDKGIAVIFWDNVEDMQANDSEVYEAILKKMMPLFATMPTTFLHEVVCEIQPKVERAVLT